ncbi:hypothetical protein LVD15_12080 [Fulvivirga maritima]|uniref:hypothetical protein n=1 Tax=Fulvivirga maritima TaxID=2904247 RepID=UPI001F294936|nr:hypothetical protein [Fulvivirga maritima]UII29133.1 hypothetical protein LVD15_12080 [Fulvivirga maritima]
MINSNKLLFSNPANYEFAFLASIAYGFLIFVICDWLLHLNLWLTILIIASVLFLFISFSLYDTKVYKDQIYQQYKLGVLFKTKLIDSIDIEKVSFKVTGEETNYFHIYYRTKKNFIKKKSILVRSGIRRDKLTQISNHLKDNNIEVTGF